MIPYLCPELPRRRRRRCTSWSKTPLVYTSVAMRNWQAFRSSDRTGVYAPGSYHSYFRLQSARSISARTDSPSIARPSRSCVRMVRTPCKPGPIRARAEQAPDARSCWPRRSRPSNATSAISSRARWARAVSIRRATSRPSRSIAGRTATRRNTTRCGIRRCRRAQRCERHRPGALRAHQHRELGFRRRRIHGFGHRSGGPRRQRAAARQRYARSVSNAGGPRHRRQRAHHLTPRRDARRRAAYGATAATSCAVKGSGRGSSGLTVALASQLRTAASCASVSTELAAPGTRSM